MPALSCGLWAAYSHTMRPPQQKPVTAARSARPLPDCSAQPSVASKSLHDLGVRHLADDGQNLPDIGQLRDIPLAGVQFGRDGQITQLGQPPAHILDVFVHAKDFLHDKHDRQSRFPFAGEAQ